MRGVTSAPMPAPLDLWDARHRPQRRGHPQPSSRMPAPGLLFVIARLGRFRERRVLEQQTLHAPRRPVCGPRGLATSRRSPTTPRSPRLEAATKAVKRTAVYSAATPAGAENMAATFVTAKLSAGVWAEPAMPPGCRTQRVKSPATARPPGGSSRSTATSARPAEGPRLMYTAEVSAQYMILTKADENAN